MDPISLASVDKQLITVKKKKIPQISLDVPDLKRLTYALKEIGAFEVVGEDIKKLTFYTENALKASKNLLSLPLEDLEKVPTLDYHGFHNVKRLSLEANQISSTKKVRNQIAFHTKINRDSYSPKNFDMAPLYSYFREGMNVLHTIYHLIGDKFIDPIRLSNFKNDEQSMLTIRRYFEKDTEQAENFTTDYPSHAHTDYGLLTMIVSDIAGLEIKLNDFWVKVPATPGCRYYIIIGDWLKFQMNERDFRSCIHRVADRKSVV
jgi:isopenicillin N synthase-like dioxygenase